MKLIANGLGVSPGTVRGKVVIVHGFEDNERFEDENILVTNLTDPTMVPMMNRAAGIICNIGGMTSHPSIVSRELGIPCVVSTKDQEGKKITEILKDGDEVEINGETGEVFLL